MGGERTTNCREWERLASLALLREFSRTAWDPALALFGWSVLVWVGEGQAKDYVHFPFLLRLLGSMFCSAESSVPGIYFRSLMQNLLFELWFNDIALILYIISMLKCSSNASLIFSKTVVHIHITCLLLQINLNEVASSLSFWTIL